MQTTIDLFAVPGIETAVFEFCGQEQLQRIVALGQLPIPEPKSWDRNPHCQLDFGEVVQRPSCNGHFICHPLPERIVITQRWTGLSFDDRLRVVAHEVAHADHFQKHSQSRGYTSHPVLPPAAVSSRGDWYWKMQDRVNQLWLLPAKYG